MGDESSSQKLIKMAGIISSKIIINNATVSYVSQDLYSEIFMRWTVNVVWTEMLETNRRGNREKKNGKCLKGRRMKE